jgi:leader peptidase (prepilin peptidase) / N-methyltransferase
VNWFIATPMPARLILLFAVGAVLGALANIAAYGLAWSPRQISPWMRPRPAAPRRSLWDRVPIFGWLGLRREASVHGAGFWVRPLVVELLFGLGLAGLYCFEVGRLGLYPADLPRPPNPLLPLSLTYTLHQQFFAHAILIWLMLAASLIDVDEKIIPDAISRPGTLAGLVLAAVWPWSLLPDVLIPPVGKPVFSFVCITSPNYPNGWPGWLDGAPHAWSLAIGLGCWALWCLAILPRTWYVRHGWPKALRLCWARAMRERDTYRILCMGVLGAMLISFVWYRGDENWTALLSSLVGMAAGGGIIWSVRIVGSRVLRQEAMGFGDVTLMSMIGAFLGWQSCLIIFFLAPFAALVVGLLRYVCIRDREIPYGPFLCMATLALILYWAAIWDWAGAVLLAFGWYVPLAMLACLALMVPLLFLLRAIFDAVHRIRS